MKEARACGGDLRYKRQKSVSPGDAISTGFPGFNDEDQNLPTEYWHRRVCHFEGIMEKLKRTMEKLQGTQGDLVN